MKTKLTNIFGSTAAFAAVTVLAITLAAVTAIRGDPPLPGAIYTTDNTCTGVDLNIYGSKGDVYLNGGPSHAGALPDGTYYVQVTNPGGDVVLGTSIGSANETPFVVSGGHVMGCYQLSGILIKISDGTPGYDDTNNPGGEYKVWVSNESSFINNSTKTDCFKVNTEEWTYGTIKVIKFYDKNANGVWDAGEPQITGWRFQLFADDNLLLTRETPGEMEVDPGNYHVIESDPVESDWVHTTPVEVQVIVAADQTQEVDFGNVCLGPGGGLTLGFWSNKNGQSKITAADLTFLSGSLNLVNNTGSAFDPNSKTALADWLLSATASNMAYMLSAQLTAMELNVRHSYVNQNALVYAPCLLNSSFPATPGLNNGFISINDLMTAANAELGLHPYTFARSLDRDYEECLKTALDNANNNFNFVQSSPCPFSFDLSAPGLLGHGR